MIWKGRPTSRYDIIYCDCPWWYHDCVQHGGKGAKFVSGANCYYPTMTEAELCGLDVKSLAEKSCLLFMWTTGPQLEVSLRVMKAWGFKYATVGFVWDKVAVNPGSYTMSQCEFVLIGKRGSIPKPRGARNVRQMVREMRTTHSHKPYAVRAGIENMFPGQSRLELFAVQGKLGWNIWGNQAHYDKGAT